MISRVILLTGAAGGIGQAIGRHLLALGHTVIGVDKVNPKAPHEYCTTYNTVNLADPPQLRDLGRRVADHYGRIDCLINNAAVGPSHIRPDAERNHPTLDELTMEQWNEAFAVNVRAPFLLAKAAMFHMKHQGWGRIINITTSYRTMLRVLPYGATKAALEAMSAIWAKELAGTGITCNVLVPGGPTDTAFIAPESGWPRNKMLRPEVMAAPAAWLCSNECGLNGMRLDASQWGDFTKANPLRNIAWPEMCYSAREWQLDSPTEPRPVLRLEPNEVV